MSDEVQDQDHAERISAVFALLTAKLEDAATLAVDGQGRRPDELLLSCADQIATLTSEACTIAGALAALLARGAAQG